MSTSFTDYVAEIIETAPAEELVALADARERMIAREDNYPDTDQETEQP